MSPHKVHPRSISSKMEKWTLSMGSLALLAWGAHAFDQCTGNPVSIARDGTRFPLDENAGNYIDKGQRVVRERGGDDVLVCVLLCAPAT